MEDASKPKFSLEVLYEIWDDKTGDHIEVGPDRDSLDLIEIRSYHDEKVERDMTMTREQAALLRDALTKLLEQ